MEAEIERLHQMIAELNVAVTSLQLQNQQSNALVAELEEKFENFRVSILSGLNV
jgi:uncharacterized coiled-coil protein SlyX